MTRMGVVLLLFSMGPLVGCQRQSEIEKVVVSGYVSYDGQPIEDGVIQFRPIEGTTGPSSSTPITKGRYKMAAKGGVPVGKHRVVINAFSGQAGELTDPHLPPSDLPAGLQFLPEKYNRESTLEFEATASSAEVQQDFLLTSR